MQPEHYPCFVVFDIVLLAGASASTRASRLRSVHKYLTWLREAAPSANRPRPAYVVLVSTKREIQLDPALRKRFVGLFDLFVPLVRHDVNPWDALSNVLRMCESNVRADEALRHFPSDVQRDSRFQSILQLPHCADPLASKSKIRPAALQSAGTPPYTEISVTDTRFEIDITINLQDHIDADTPIIIQRLRISRLRIRGDSTTFLSCPAPVIVRNCVIDRLEFENVEFENYVMLSDVRVRSRSHIRGCTFHSAIDFRTCTFTDDLHILYNTFLFRTPWFRKCSFEWRFEFRRNQFPSAYDMLGAPTFAFHRCVFAARCRIDMPAQRARLSFSSSEFREGKYTHISWLKAIDDIGGTIRSTTDFPKKLHRDRDLDEAFDFFAPAWSPGALRQAIATRFNVKEDHINQPLVDATIERIRRFHDRRFDEQEHDLSYALDVYLRFTNCHLGGRVVVTEDPQYGRGYRYRTAEGLLVILEASTVTGTFDIRGVRVRGIDVNRSSFIGGGLIMQHVQVFARQLVTFGRSAGWLTSSRTTENATVAFGSSGRCKDPRNWRGDPQKKLWWRPLSWIHNLWVLLSKLPPKFCGLLLEEQINEAIERRRFADALRWNAELGPESHEWIKDTDRERRYMHAVYSAIAQQYEDLQVALSHAPDTDQWEDYCHYKSLMYRNEASVALMPPKRYGPIVAVLIMTIAMLVFAMFVQYQGPRSPFASLIPYKQPLGGLSLLGVAVYAMAFVFVRDVKHSVSYVFNKYLFAMMLGYGVYPSRIFVSATILLFGFGFIYFAPGLIGNVGVTADTIGMVRSGTGELPQFVDALYFSAATFTTLGYGDFMPTGFMRFIAGVEAFAGVLMLAFLTVALVRQFLRR